MENGGAYHLEKQILASEVSEILQVEPSILTSLVNHGIVLPVNDPVGTGQFLWGAQEVFRAFVAVSMAHEFEEKYGTNFDYLKYDQINSRFLRRIRVKGKEIRKSEEWKEVAKRAAEHGLFFKEEY